MSLRGRLHDASSSPIRDGQRPLHSDPYGKSEISVSRGDWNESHCRVRRHDVQRLESFTLRNITLRSTWSPERNPFTAELSDIDQKVALPLSVGSGARVFVAEGDPFCALQTCTEGVQASRLVSTCLFLQQVTTSAFGPHEDVEEQGVRW